MKQEAPNLHANCIRLQSCVLLQLAIAGNMRCHPSLELPTGRHAIFLQLAIAGNMRCHVLFSEEFHCGFELAIGNSREHALPRFVTWATGSHPGLAIGNSREHALPRYNQELVELLKRKTCNWQ